MVVVLVPAMLNKSLVMIVGLRMQRVGVMDVVVSRMMRIAVFGQGVVVLVEKAIGGRIEVV